MSNLSTITRVVLPASLILSMASTPARAYTYDKLTYLTFSVPVQIPSVTLKAGTYRFRLADPASSRQVIQVLSNDASIVYAMFLTMPDSRTTITEESMVTFRETPAGVAPAIKSLFYGGESHGYEFVYPRSGPDMTVKVPVQPEITYTAMPVVKIPAQAMGSAPPVALAPPLSPVLGLSLPEYSPVPAAPELPRTASPLPLIGLSGLCALILGLGTGMLRRYLD
jgi:hypothetical protein